MQDEHTKGASKVIDHLLFGFINVWIGFALLINIFSIITIFWFDGWQKVTEIYNPFDIVNSLMEIALFSPAIGAKLWLDRREKRRAEVIARQ
jgi:hypothetical protein